MSEVTSSVSLYRGYVAHNVSFTCLRNYSYNASTRFCERGSGESKCWRDSANKTKLRLTWSQLRGQFNVAYLAN